MGRKITRESFRKLRESFYVLSLDELSSYIGLNNCVLWVFVDVGNHSIDWWEDKVDWYFGYNVYDNGGLYTEDIIPLGSIGGLNIQELTGNTFTFNNSTGKLAGGSTLMLSFNNGIVAHAVIATSYYAQDGMFTYKDPQNNNKVGFIYCNQLDGLYSVSQ